ncbi:MSMEG_0570 family nitrogen starvation response protein [Pseudomonas sp. NPDC089554]|uniref:MSMEG_0570 family nitrogen starvation response protein n=1 Tax=Pseudomonas sp. NPDC089554 TaxID=3390653 RepID=UPI003D0600F5
MPAVNIRLRWPDGQETDTYSPSTTVHEYFAVGQSYPLEHFMRLAENALNAASERVREVKGFYCSSAMDSLGGLRIRARQYPDPQQCVTVLDIRQYGASPVNYAAFGDI